jgi:hypothetical protein
MQNAPNEILGNSTDGHIWQNGNMGRSDQQTTGEGKKLDLQSSQPGREAYPYQSGPPINFRVYDVSVPCSQRNTTKDKINSKRFPMERY